MSYLQFLPTRQPLGTPLLSVVQAHVLPLSNPGLILANGGL